MVHIIIYTRLEAGEGERKRERGRGGTYRATGTGDWFAERLRAAMDVHHNEEGVGPFHWNNLKKTPAAKNL